MSMKKLMFSMLAVACLGIATPAMADPPGGNPNDPGPLPGCSPSDTQPQKCDDTPGNPGGGNTGGNGGNGGNGGDGGSVVVGDITNTNTATGGSATSTATGGNATATGGSATGGSVTDSGNSTNTNTNTNTNDNSSTATATGGAGGAGGTATASGGAGGQGGASSSNSGGNTLTNTTNYKRAHRNAAAAYAPSFVVGNCQNATSGGISTPFGGISLGGTRSNKFCELERMSVYAKQQLNRDDLSCQIMALDKRFNEALRRTGVGCPAYQPVAAPVVVAPQTQPELPAAPPYPQPGPERG